MCFRVMVTFVDFSAQNCMKLLENKNEKMCFDVFLHVLMILNVDEWHF